MNEVHAKGVISRINQVQHWVWLETDWGHVKFSWPEDSANLQQGFECLELKDEIIISGHLIMQPISGGLSSENACVRITTCEAIKPARRAKEANAWFYARERQMVNTEMYPDYYDKRYKEARDAQEVSRQEARDAQRALSDMREKYKEAVMGGLFGGDSGASE